jgi:CubicO group peptidase (beta-lactamase class C family)
MRRLAILVPLAALLIALPACGDDPAAPVGARPYAECTTATPYVPTGGWRSNCPGALGMDSTTLRRALDDIGGQMPTLEAFVVARKGYIVLEGYWNGARASTPLDIRSVTKAVTASVVATEIRAGRIPGMEEPLRTYWGWLTTTDDPRHATLTVRHLLDLSAGFDMQSPGLSSIDAPTWYLTRPFGWDPGQHWQYDEGLYDVLSALVRRVDTRGMRDAARADLFAPLGIAGAASRWPVDASGNAYGAAGLRLTAREMLSLGELYRRDGVWDAQQVLPADWVAPMRVRPAGLADDVQVWFRGWRQVMLDGHLTLFTIGYGGQYIVVVPDLDLVVAAGAIPNVQQSGWPSVLRLVGDYLIPASSAQE